MMSNPCTTDAAQCAEHYFGYPDTATRLCFELFHKLHGYSPQLRDGSREYYVRLIRHFCQQVFNAGSAELGVQIGGPLLDTTIDYPANLHVRILYGTNDDLVSLLQAANLPIRAADESHAGLQGYLCGKAPRRNNKTIPDFRISVMANHLRRSYTSTESGCEICPRSFSMGLAEFESKYWGATCVDCERRIRHLGLFRDFGIREGVIIGPMGHNPARTRPQQLSQDTILYLVKGGTVPDRYIFPSECDDMSLCAFTVDDDNFHSSLNNVVGAYARTVQAKPPCPPFLCFKINPDG